MHPVELTEKEIEILISTYKTEIEQQQLIAAEATNKIKVASARIQALTSPAMFPENPAPAQFRISVPFEKWTLADKALRILNTYSMVATTRTIATLIKKNEGGEYVEADISTLVNNLSATLKQKIDKDEVFQRSEIGGEFYYGIKGWFENDGMPMESRTPRSVRLKIQTSLPMNPTK